MISPLGIQDGNRFSVQDSALDVPNMRDTLSGWMRPLGLSLVMTQIVNFRAEQVERPLEAVGNDQPMSAQQLALKPEGQRAWKWRVIWTTTDLRLKPDDVIIRKGQRYRVMGFTDWEDAGFFKYEVVNDYANSTTPTA